MLTLLALIVASLPLAAASHPHSPKGYTVGSTKVATIYAHADAALVIINGNWFTSLSGSVTGCSAASTYVVWGTTFGNSWNHQPFTVPGGSCAWRGDGGSVAGTAQIYIYGDMYPSSALYIYGVTRLASDSDYASTI